MALLSNISPFYFFLAFAVGILFCYLTKPKPQMVIKFPSPLNAGKVVYKEDDSCFTFQASKVSCPMDKSLIKPQPIGE